MVGLEPTFHSNLFAKSLGLEPRCRHGTSLLGLSTRMRLNPLRRQAQLVPRIAREWCLHSAPPAPIWRSTPALISVLQLGSDYPPKPSLSRSASHWLCVDHVREPSLLAVVRRVLLERLTSHASVATLRHRSSIVRRGEPPTMIQYTSALTTFRQVRTDSV